MSVLQRLKKIAERDLEENPALGLKGYRKGELQRAVIAAALELESKAKTLSIMLGEDPDELL